MTRAHKLMFPFKCISLRFVFISEVSSIWVGGDIAWRATGDRRKYAVHEVNEWYHAWHYLLLSNTYTTIRISGLIPSPLNEPTNLTTECRHTFWLNRNGWETYEQREMLKTNFISCDKERKRQCSGGQIPSHATVSWYWILCPWFMIWRSFFFLLTAQFNLREE